MKIVRTKDTPWADALTKGKYKQRRKALGGEKLTCSLWELPPGHKSFPMHAHEVTEEGLFVVSGSMKVRTPEGETPVSAGDYVSFPPGGAAHQLLNDGTEPCVYVGMAAITGFDVVRYPESGKISTALGGFPKGKRFIFREDAQVDYFDGDKDAET